MSLFRESRSGLLTSLAVGLLLSTRLAAEESPAPAIIHLFRVMTMREDVLLGLSEPELELLGTGSPVDRLARRIAEAGHLSGWRYAVGRGGDGAICLVARNRVAVLRQDALLLEAYAPILRVVAPPE